ADPCNADAWWLFALAVSDTETKHRALTRLLELRPDDMRARQLFDSISVRQMRSDARTASAGIARTAVPPYPPQGMEPRLPRLRGRRTRQSSRRSGRPRAFFFALMMASLFGIAGCAVFALALG